MMIAVDTNLLVRLATNDDKAARKLVAALFETEDILIAKTVLLESEWLLRSRFSYQPKQVLMFLEYLSALLGVMFEDEAAVLRAI